jgi:hypothetical protein
MIKKLLIILSLMFVGSVGIALSQEVKVTPENVVPEIVGPTETTIGQPVWLTLSLSNDISGKFDDKNSLLDTDPAHVAPNVALFFTTEPGEYRIVAVYVIDGKAITFLEKIISVKGTKPPTSEDITVENITKWIALVPEDARNESMTNPLNQTVMTRQEAIGQTFLNIGNAGSAIGSIAGLELMLSTALTPILGDSASQWQIFADKVDNALTILKDGAITDYAKAYIIIGETLINE